MAKKATRLRFDEEELKNGKVAKAAKKADKAADKADKASAKLPTKRKLRRELASAASAKKKLRFEKVDVSRPDGIKRTATRAPLDTVSGTAHRQVSQYEDDNVGVQAAHQLEEIGEGAVHAVDHASYSHKLKQYDKADKLMKKSDSANVEALFQKKMAEADATTNPLSRWMQKRQIKKEYAAMKAGSQTAGTAAGHAAGAGATKGAGKAGKESATLMDKLFEFVSAHSHVIIVILIIAGLFMVIMSAFSSCSMMLGGTSDVIIDTSYTSEDDDILAVDADYTALETALRNQVNSIEADYPGYDEYNYDLDEIGHNPFELASLLTVILEYYTESSAQSELQRIFDAQYDLSIDEVIEVRTRTETRTGTRTVTETDPDTGETSSWEEEYEYEVEVEYDYYILNVTLDNKGLSSVVGASGLTEDQMSRYAVLQATYGNKQYLFADSIYAISSEGTSYTIPPEALSDERFANMIAEAEKYLGYPYVWGGSSPSTSFDCSGFVSWVINNCGNGWSYGRLTANGLKNICTIVSASDAQPGDLIFFQGTYDTAGASHVGIYVGNGMMIHCGNPIQYTSINTSYWQAHFLCYGRLP